MEQCEASERVERLVVECGERAFRFARRLTGDTESAKELVQEAYRRVLANWERYDHGQPLENWFFSILRHIFLDVEKKIERVRVVSIDLPLINGNGQEALLAEKIADREEPIELVLERRERADVVRAALRRLSYEHRVALVLCDMEGLSYDEIALVLGCAVGTVRSRVSRARVAMRQALAGRLGEAEVLR